MNSHAGREKYSPCTARRELGRGRQCDKTIGVRIAAQLSSGARLNYVLKPQAGGTHAQIVSRHSRGDASIGGVSKFPSSGSNHAGRISRYSSGSAGRKFNPACRVCHAPGLRPRRVRDAQSLWLKHCVRDNVTTRSFRVVVLVLANKMARDRAFTLKARRFHVAVWPLTDMPLPAR